MIILGIVLLIAGFLLYPHPEQQEGVTCVQPGNPCDAWP